MMSCCELVELVTEYVEGTIDAERLARFEEHLAECPPCVHYIEQFRQTIEALGRLPSESVSPEAERELAAAFRDWHAAEAG